MIDSKLENKLNSFANNCYRKILGIKLLDKIPLDDIYERVKKGPLINSIRKRQLGWLGHTLRRDDDEPIKQLALYVPEPSHGTTRRGAPPLSYLTQTVNLVFGDAKELKLTKKDVETAAKDRVQWRKRIYQLEQSIPPSRKSKIKQKLK